MIYPHFPTAGQGREILRQQMEETSVIYQTHMPAFQAQEATILTSNRRPERENIQRVQKAN